jgi:hypothetical protein
VTRNANTVTCHGSRNWSPCEANIGARKAAASDFQQAKITGADDEDE